MNEKWHVVYLQGHESNMPDSLAIGPHEFDPADCFAFSVNCPPGEVPEDVERKFQLMAAAPDLLAACLALLADADAKQEDQEACRRLYNSWRSVREAVAKALGK